MSLRLRLLVAVGLISIVALVVADFATYSALRTSLYHQADQELSQRPFHLRADVATNTAIDCQAPPGVSRGGDTVQSGGAVGNSGQVGNSGPGPIVGGNGIPNVFGIYYVAVANPNGSVVGDLECPAYVGSHAYKPVIPSHISGYSTQPNGTQVAYFTSASQESGGPNFRVQSTLQNGVNFIQAVPLTDQDGTLHTLFLTEFAVTAGAIVLALVGGWWLVRLGLRPLGEVEATADSIAAGNLDQRVPGANEPTEVGRLARALNVMLERIQTAFDARVRSETRLKQNEQHLRQFVADASHELRTPIAAVSAYAELFERGAATRPEDLPRIVSGIRTETARMERLVSDLLTLARLDEGVPVNREPVELVALVSEAVHTATAVGPEWPVQFWAARPVEVTGDKDRLRQVIDNLLANVRAHTPEGTSTTVRVDVIGDQAEIEVRDTGQGMSGDEANRVFERFYRADPARSRISGGSGLGLSIVAAIVEAHDGTVTASSAPGEGLTVTVRMPLSVVASDPAEAQSAPQLLT